MDVNYQRSPNRSYMILTGEQGEGNYEQEMLRQNAVKLLLSFYMVELNQGIQVWYDITRLRSVKDIVRQEGVTIENLYMVLSSIAAAFSMLSQYLIQDRNILMNPDTVYFDREDPPNVRLCYCPLEHDDFAEQMREFFAFYMDEVDHRKGQVTKLVYRLYEMCQDPVTLEELVDTVRREMPADTDPEMEMTDFTPSEERVISIGEETDAERYAQGMDEMQEDAVVIKKRETHEKKGIREKIYTYLAEKFPVLTRITKKHESGGGAIEQNQAPHDFSRDFVFDPDTELQQKTVFMRQGAGKDEMGRKYEDHFEGLLVYEGDSGETNYQIRTGSFRIGSQEGENEAVLHSKVVSRHHAMITREDGDFFLEDLNSTNGTYLNGKLLPYRDRVKLSRMDQIVFADVAYHIV